MRTRRLPPELLSAPAVAIDFTLGRILPSDKAAKRGRPFSIMQKNPQPFYGLRIFALLAYRKIYFRINSTVSTYISGVIFFSLALPVRTLISVQEMMPMAIPSEIL